MTTNRFLSLFFVLPEDIFIQILQEYLILSDRLEFAKTNRLTSAHVLKKVREVYLRSIPFERFHTIESFRNEILNLIHYPHRQLNGRLILPWKNVNTEKVLEGPFSFKVVKVSHEYLITNAFQQSKPEIADLFISWEFKYLSATDIDNVGRALEALKSIGHSIRSIIHNHYSFEQLPCSSYFPNLQSLTLVDCASLYGFESMIGNHLKFVNLRRCHEIKDVNCLGRIHELILENCNGIHDISSLQYNQKIIIRDCDNIENYSNCFQFSQVISLTISTPKCFTPINIETLLRVQALSIHGSGSQYGIRRYFDGEKSFPPSLKSFTITHCHFAFTLPPNQLRSINIERCPLFLDLINFDHIASINFTLLKIPSLQGLGRKNRFVSLTCCDGITDFSPLKDCEQVKILFCAAFYDGNDFVNFKKFTVASVNHHDERSLDRVTHLIIDNSIRESKFSLLKSFQMIREVKIVTKQYMFIGEEEESQIMLLSQYPTLEKISISANNLVKVNERWQMIGMLYDIQFVPLERKIVLLPKRI